MWQTPPEISTVTLTVTKENLQKCEKHACNPYINNFCVNLLTCLCLLIDTHLLPPGFVSLRFAMTGHEGTWCTWQQCGHFLVTCFHCTALACAVSQTFAESLLERSYSPAFRNFLIPVWLPVKKIYLESTKEAYSHRLPHPHPLHLASYWEVPG